MTHDEAKHLLRPLARGDRAAPPVDVSDWVMRDVRAIAAARPAMTDDAFVWTLAAACAGVAAIVVVTVATLAADENPLVEFASAVTIGVAR